MNRGGAPGAAVRGSRLRFSVPRGDPFSRSMHRPSRRAGILPGRSGWRRGRILPRGTVGWEYLAKHRIPLLPAVHLRSAGLLGSPADLTSGCIGRGSPGRTAGHQ